VKQYLKRLGNWIGKQLLRFFLFCKGSILATPGRLKQGLFSFAEWGRQQLDKRINTLQKERLHTIIFKNETKEGVLFDTILIWVIIASIIVVILETVVEFHKIYWWLFFVLEWVFTLIFTIEYIFRLYAARQPLGYATSFFGIVDLLSIVPTYFGIFFIAAGNLIIVRALRLLRIFRIFKMGHFVSEGEIILSALRASRTKIYVFVSFIVLMSMIIGSVLYIVEGGTNPKLNNIPKGIYWAIVTLTTVGYGDVTPITPFGKFLATVVMIMGYGVIAVPTGIVTAEISSRVMNMKEIIFKECKSCGQVEHHTEAIFCHKCSASL
jgi:voltage-gated potassium channel